MGRGLRDYFRSGWAFFIPYFAVYLLYAGLKWPVNPVIREGHTLPVFRIPCLLHVYWAFHAIHLVSGVLALRTWWTHFKEHPGDLPRPGDSRSSTLWSLVPWLCLAAIFWIPGIYLEWPSDPWEHLRRINEWHILDQVTAHSTWKKSSYFLPYSFTAHTTGLAQLSGLNFYYTAACLLLSWQYYRLAKAVGLSSRAALGFVLLNALALGNNIFSFYRYYGLSSSIFAQIGALALTRIAFETLNKPATPPAFSSRFGMLHPLLRAIAAALVLLPWILFSHVQGIGIAGLGIFAAIVWHLVGLGRQPVAGMIGATITASLVAALWFPGRAELSHALVSQGWMTGWYAFDLFSPASPALERSLQILGGIGVINLLLGFWLAIRRNHPAGWLTVIPLLVLIIPCFALPFARMLVSNSGDAATFSRMLLAIPAGLAAATVLDLVILNRAPSRSNGLKLSGSRDALILAGIALAALGLSGRISAGRFWHGLQVTPDDLQLVRYVETAANETVATQDPNVMSVDTALAKDVSEAFRPSRRDFASRQPRILIADRQLMQQLDWLAHVNTTKTSGPALSLKPPLASAVLQGRTTVPPFPRTIAAPTTVATPWILLGGVSPEYAFSDGGWSLANPRGQVSEIFSPDLIPIARDTRYRLSSSLREEGNPGVLNYVAVAWFNSDKELLKSNVPMPGGAGEPMGWSNGTYSYYGSARPTSPGQTTHYSITFGLGEPTEIPQNAKYMRLGALLNYRAETGAKVVLSDVTLVAIPPPSLLLTGVWDFSQQTSPRSFSALLSGHWAPNHLSIAQAGAKELHEALDSAAKR